MLNTVVRWVTRLKIVSFVLLFVVILSLGFTTLPEAAPKPDKIKKAKLKTKKTSSNKSAVQQLLGPGQIGKWDPIDSTNATVVAVHMSVLPNGKVIYWDGNLTGGQTRYQIWNPESAAGPSTAERFFVPASFGNLYCSGHSFLPDGRLLVTGGQEINNPTNNFMGIKKAALYDHVSGQWSQLPEMNDRRWYPTNLILGSGNTLVWAGVSENGQLNKIPQILEKQFDGTLAWRSLSIRNKEPYNINYSWLHLLSSGTVFAIYGQEGKSYSLSIGERSREPRLFDYPINQTNPPLPDGSLTDPHDNGASVVYDKDKILVFGGADLPKATAEIVNFDDPAHQWRRVGRLEIGRRHANATLLPNGKVLATGGNKGGGFNNNCLVNFVYKAEMWDPNAPGTEPGIGWQPLASATQRRLYHSTAVLLPDGRVLTGGTTSFEAGQVINEECPAHTDNYNLEVFSPPYLFNSNGTPATRPVIGVTPVQVSYGQTIQFTVSDADENSKVNLIRLPSVTHSFNQSQGFNKLTRTISGQNFSVTMPANRNECPPGYYMMFVVNTAGVPSKAKIIQVL